MSHTESGKEPLDCCSTTETVESMERGFELQGLYQQQRAVVESRKPDKGV